MSLTKAIKRVQKLIEIQKKLVHEPRDGRPVVAGAAGLSKQQLEQSKKHLQMLQTLSKHQKKAKKKRS